MGRELGRRETTSPEGVGVVQCWQLCLGSGRVRDSEGSLTLFGELEDKRGIVSALTMLGAVAMLGQQDLETVPVLYGEAMSLKEEEVENPRAHAYLLLFSGIVAVGWGDCGGERKRCSRRALPCVVR